jgi:hypothetical protein
MSVLNVLKESFITAAEMVALVLVAPAFGAESTAASRVDISDSRIELVVRNSRAEVRLAQRIINTSASMLDLATRLPAIDDSIESLRVLRGARAIELAHPGADCDGGLGQRDESSHARVAIDEAIADALSLAPGESAWIEIATSRPLPQGAQITRVHTRGIASLAAQSLLVNDGEQWLLLVVPGADARGTAQVRLRPRTGPAQRFDLGVIDARGTLFVIALAQVDAEALTAGAVEFESASAEGSVWATLPLRVADPVPSILSAELAR